MKLKINIDGTPYEVEIEGDEPANESEHSPLEIQSSVLPTAKLAASPDFDEVKVCRSPLAGVVARLHVSPGQNVQPNDLLLTLDAMKMEIKVTAQSAGTIKSVEVKPGEAVKPSQILVRLE